MVYQVHVVMYLLSKNLANKKKQISDNISFLFRVRTKLAGIWCSTSNRVD